MAAWVAEMIALEKTIIRMTIDARLISESVRQSFINGWQAAGGYE